MTLIEVTMAVTILIVVALGGAAFMINGRVIVERAGKKRAAVQVAAERLERARAAGYAALANANGTATLDGTTFTWTLTVTAPLADPGDAASAYKQMEVSVDWPTSGGIPVVARSALSP